MFIIQFLVLHDVKTKHFFSHDTAQSIGHCPTGCLISAGGGRSPGCPALQWEHGVAVVQIMVKRLSTLPSIQVGLLGPSECCNYSLRSLKV